MSESSSPGALPQPSRSHSSHRGVLDFMDFEGATEEVNLVVYSKKPASEVFHQIPEHIQSAFRLAVCKTLDDLLQFFEVDGIDAIVFDESVSGHEVHYITRWARIFKPAVRCIQGQNPIQ